MPLSVIIPLHRLRERIDITLRALERQTLDRSQYELIFVEDGSNDGTADVIDAWGSGIDRHVIRNATNQGRSTTRNRGVARARGDVLVFLDGDMIPHPDLLRTYHQRFAAGGCDVVSGRRRSIDLSSHPVLDGDYEVLRECSVLGQLPVVSQARLERDVEVICRDYPGSLTRALAFITSNVAVRAEAFAATRGFFPGLSRFEDTDLGLQLAQLGARFAYDPTAEAIHPFDVVAATPQEHRDAFTALVSRHPYIAVVLWWCWALRPEVPPDLVDIARAEVEGGLDDLDWRALARARDLYVPGSPEVSAGAIARCWASVHGVDERAAAATLRAAAAAGVLHVRRDGDLLFDLASITAWVAEHTAFRQQLYERSFFSRRGAVPAPSAPRRTVAWWGRYEVAIPAAVVADGSARLNLALPVITRCQREVELNGWQPPELAQYARDGMIVGFPVPGDMTVGYSFRCQVSEFDRELPQTEVIDRETWLRPLSYDELPGLDRVLARIAPARDAPPLTRARAIYTWMLDATEYRVNSLHGLATAGTGIGHCIQLARLFVALCRRAGIPARERCGALVDRVRPGAPDLQAETADRISPFAHTWAEILVGDGWTPVELLPIGHGRRAVSPWNFPDADARGRITAEGAGWDAFYFTGLDAFRIHASKWANELPLLMRRAPAWTPVSDANLQVRHRMWFAGEVVS